MKRLTTSLSLIMAIVSMGTATASDTPHTEMTITIHKDCTLSSWWTKTNELQLQAKCRSKPKLQFLNVSAVGLEQVQHVRFKTIRGSIYKTPPLQLTLTNASSVTDIEFTSSMPLTETRKADAIHIGLADSTTL